MLVPLKVTCRNMESTPSLVAAIEKKVAWLEGHCPNLVSCHVVVEAPRGHHRKGELFRVRVDATAPGVEVVVGRDPAESSDHTDVYVAIRDAFRAARRSLESREDRRRVLRERAETTPQPTEGL